MKAFDRWFARGVISALCLIVVPGTAYAANPDPALFDQAETVAEPSGVSGPPKDGYVQLEVTLSTPDADAGYEMRRCPKPDIWEFDVKNLKEGDEHITFGVSVEIPDVPTAVSLLPLDIKRESTGLLGLGSKCIISIDELDYSSPLVSIRKNASERFRVTTSYVQTNQLSAAVHTSIKSFLTTMSHVAGIPTAVAAPVIESSTAPLNGLNTSSKTEWTRYLRVADGSGQEKSWVVNDVLLDGRKGPPTDIVLTAKLVYRESLIEKPAWPLTPAAVLNSPFYANGPTANPSRTLGGFLTTYAASEINKYQVSPNDQVAGAECVHLRERIGTIGLTDHDAALSLWAMARGRTGSNGATKASIDNMACLDEVWLYTQDEISKTPIDTAPAPVAKTAPSIRQMKATIDSDNAFSRFFQVANWNEQREYAEALFTYPTDYRDPSSTILSGSNVVPNSYAWLSFEFGKDQPLTKDIGCYAYFDLSARLLTEQTAADGQSMMLAIATVGRDKQSNEVLVKAYFAPVDVDHNPLISKISVAETMTDNERSMMLSAVKSKTRCPSGYSPDLLFSP